MLGKIDSINNLFWKEYNILNIFNDRGKTINALHLGIWPRDVPLSVPRLKLRVSDRPADKRRCDIQPIRRQRLYIDDDNSRSLPNHLLFE